jgi:hypothetical protein
MPKLIHTAALWSLVQYPSAEKEWDMERKLAAIKEAGFEAAATQWRPETGAMARKLGLKCVGYVCSGTKSEFGPLLEVQRDSGAHHINVQMADHDTPVEEAIDLAIHLMAESRRLGVKAALEVHRDTCTETPEKTFAIADGYQKATGELLPMTWDHSHIGVVKHLAPPFERCLERPDLIQRASQMHMRPFNGHHCQVPVTNGHGELTQEVKDWLVFAESLLALWLEGNRGVDRELYVVPEMGPVQGGYNLSTLPNSWEDAKVLRMFIGDIWQKLTGEENAARPA